MYIRGEFPWDGLYNVLKYAQISYVNNCEFINPIVDTPAFVSVHMYTRA